MSRHIPILIDRQIKKDHYFECAWCGVQLTERHHIVEYSKGGQHTVENLILLCPNCHTQVHNNEISEAELLQRKSTHIKGDRISGSIQFEIVDPIVKLGNSIFNNVPILLRYKEEDIIELRKNKNDNYILTCRFYDIYGNLIFWMSSNRYWSNSNFEVIYRKNELSIKNTDNELNNLRIWIEDNQLYLTGNNYINGNLIDFSPDYITYGNKIIQTFNASNCLVGIYIF